MKKFLVLFFSIFICSIAHADTETINWYVDGTSYATTTCQTGGDIILPNTPTKYGYTFQGWSVYTPIEYLESTGTQWIDTGVVPSPNCELELKYRIYEIADVFHGIYGAHTSDSEPTIRHLYKTTEYYLLNADSIPPYFYFSSSPSINIDYTEKMDSIGWIINGVRYDNPYVRTKNCTTTMKVFDRSNSNGRGLHGRIYYFKMWNNNTLVRDFIPVLDGSGTPCMYDKVSKTFFYNQGTGDFIAGPVINQ